MALEDLRVKYVFPKIPLHLAIPKGHPDVGNISSISVVPEISDIHFGRNEAELKGQYTVTVSYFAAKPGDNGIPAGGHNRADDFFRFLKVQENGFLHDDEGDQAAVEEDPGELYTAEFTKPIHTFVDGQFIISARGFQPVLAVERINLSGDGSRRMKGDLVLALLNRDRERRRF